MSELIKVKNTIRDFLRKYEEIIFPILRFIWCYLVFHSIHNMFNYMDLFDRKIVLFLLAAMCAMLPDGFLVFMTGLMIGVNCFSVSLEVGLSFTLLFLLMYCLYIRFFPKYSFVLYLVPLCYMINMPFLAPLLAAVFAGIGGALPSAFGVVLYRFSIYTRDIANALSTAEDEESVEVLKYYLENILKNKEILMIMIVFMLTVVVTSVLHKLSYPFAWYVAILVGALVCIFSYMILGNALDLPTDTSSCVAGSLLGMLIGMVVQTVKGVLDFPHTQRVQFEDDDFYYYVKAVPKLDAPKKKKKRPEEGERRPLTPEERERRAAARAAAEGRRPLTPEERERRAAARAAMEAEGRRPLTPEERERRAAARAYAEMEGRMRRRPGRPGENPEGNEEAEARTEAVSAPEAGGEAEVQERTEERVQESPVREEPAEEKNDVKEAAPKALTPEEREAERERRVAERAGDAVRIKPLGPERARDEAVSAEPVRTAAPENGESGSAESFIEEVRRSGKVVEPEDVDED